MAAMVGETLRPALAARPAQPGRFALLVNFALYQVGWFACVLGAARGLPWIGAGLALVCAAVHLLLVRDRTREALLMAAAAVLGLAVDSLQLRLGVFTYPGGTPLEGIAPPWILVLWLQFATLLHYGLRWMSGRYLLAAVLGFAGGPLSFWAGERVGAIEFASTGAYLVLACVWAAVMPALIWLGDRLAPRRAGYR